MYYRILEIKESYKKSKYIPQYKKNYWSTNWNNIMNDQFINSTFCCERYKKRTDKTIYNKTDAELLIIEFKNYMLDDKYFVKIHKM